MKYPHATPAVRRAIALVSSCALVATSVITGTSAANAQAPDGNGSISDLTSPVGIAVNSLGERFVAQNSTATVAVYGPNDDVTPVRTLTGLPDAAWAIAFDSAGAAFVTCPNSGHVYVFNAGETTPSRVLSNADQDPDSEPFNDDDPLTDPFAQPLGIAINSQDEVFLANDTNDDESVYVFDSGAGLPNPAKKISNLVHPTSLAIDVNDNVFIGSVGSGSDSVKVVPANQTAIDSNKTISGLQDVYGLAFGVAGRLYAVDNATTPVVRVYAPGTLTPLTGKTLTGLGQTIGIASVPATQTALAESTIFATQYLAGTIKRFSPGPLVEADPADLTFGNTLVGTNTTVTVTVSNPGSANLTLPSDAVTTTSANGQYTITSNTCTATTLVPTTGTCSFGVRFAPTARGVKSMEIAIASNSPDSPYRLPVTGTGIAPVASTAPGTWDFGSLPIASPATSKNFVVTNSGDAALVFPASTVDLTGSNANQFRVATDGCSGSSVLPDQTCTITVEFDPSTTGAKTANLRISPSAPETSHSYPLSGTGTSPTFSPSTSSVDLGQIATGFSSTPATVTVTNSGTAPLIFGGGAVALGNETASGFSIDSDTCSAATLQPSETCVVVVSFTATDVGNYSGSLQFTDNAPGSPHTVALAAQAVPPSPNATPDQASLAFDAFVLPDAVATSKTVRFTNDGTSTLAVGNSASVIVGTDSADFTITADTCSNNNFAIGEHCDVTVQFAPSSVGTKVATLQLASNEPASPRTVSLGGSAIAVPSAPGAVVAAAGNQRASVSWTTPASDGNSPITGYRVKVATSAVGPFTQSPSCTSNLTSLTRTCTITGLTNNTTYYVQVVARNAAGDGAAKVSNPVTPRAVAQTIVRCAIPTKAKKTGTTVIIPGPCRTNAGQLVAVSAKKTGATKVVKSGSKWSVVMAKKKGTATFTLTAPATGIYLPMKRVIVYRN